MARDDPAPEVLAEEVAINLTGVLNTAALFLPHLKQRSQAWFVVVASGLGYVPLVKAPVYSATKAAVHAFASALREQLRPTPVRVVTLVPPAVETNLHAGLARRPPRLMPLDAFTAAAMRGFANGSEVIDVGDAKSLRVASRLAPSAVRRALNRAAG